MLYHLFYVQLNEESHFITYRVIKWLFNSECKKEKLIIYALIENSI
mgnify:CR=1 FL=1